MVLFQLFISGYTNVGGVQRIRATGNNPFRGRCRINFLNYGVYFSVSRQALLRVDSDELYNNNYDFKLIVPLDGSAGISTSKNNYYWESDLVSPTITIDIVEADQAPNSSTPVPSTTFVQGYFSFDIEELDKK